MELFPLLLPAVTMVTRHDDDDDDDNDDDQSLVSVGRSSSHKDRVKVIICRDSSSQANGCTWSSAPPAAGPWI